jgi:microcystin-dependent protein
MALDIPLPTELPDVDPSQYTPLLLSAIGEFLQAKDVWADTDYDTAYAYMEELKYYVVFLMQGGAMPVGGVQWSASASIPTGWLRCDGSAVLRSQYDKLFAEIGIAWGAGNGTTTFNLPDLRGRSPMGVGTSPSLSLGGLLGEQTHVLTASENGVHTHLLTDPGHAHTPASPDTVFRAAHGGGSSGYATVNAGQVITQPGATGVNGTGITVQNSAGGSAHNNIHPVAGMYPIIFAGLP